MIRRALFIGGIAIIGLAAIPDGCVAADPSSGATIALAQRERTTNTAANNKPTNRRPMAWTPAREAAAYTFAKVNHPELAEILDRLKSGKNRAAYRRAIRQLYHDSERLARLKDRDNSKEGKRYKRALRLWKLDSRIRLLTAQVATSRKPDKDLEAQLKTALKERIDLRIEQMEADHARALDRVRKLEKSIENLKANKEKAAEQHLQRVKRGLGLKRKRAARNKNRKRAAKSKKSTRP